MATPVGAPTPDTLISVKVAIDGTNRKFKFPLRDLGAHVFPAKLRSLLNIPEDQEVRFERFSDSSASYVLLNPNNPSVYKQLYRAAKAKLKLRIKATVVQGEPCEKAPAAPAAESDPPSIEQPGPSAAKVRGTPANVDAAFMRDLPGFRKDFSNHKKKLVLHDQRLRMMEANQGSSSIKPGSRPQSKSVHRCSRANMLPVPEPRHSMIDYLEPSLALDNFAPPAPLMPSPVYAIYCNNCNTPIPDDRDHYHCGVCEDGDFDLCQSCVDSGSLCQEAHWLIKRCVRNGNIINSTTETVARRLTTPEQSTAGKLHQLYEAASLSTPNETESRTCNVCIEVLPELRLVTCTSCADYDICLLCVAKSQHGHHPGHAFEPVVPETAIGEAVSSLCRPGRDQRHAAICDGCDRDICGIRHKCLDCPNWDYCSRCVMNVDFVHPGHRFAPIYAPLPPVPEAQSAKLHYGVVCDGALCASNGVKHYISGDRYKCTVCPDTDFCASCEASPSNGHNKTHPLIKFKTPVKGMSVAMVGEKGNGEAMPRMGDWPSRTRSTATVASPASLTNAATQVQNDDSTLPEKSDHFVAPRSLAQLFQDHLFGGSGQSEAPKQDFDAAFVSDRITDGTKMPPNHMFTQMWVLRNPGPIDWPAGCSVKFAGGDNMRDVDITRPCSLTTLEKSMESNVTNEIVPVGSTAQFEVKLRTSKREGQCISYWRLVGPDGSKFGDKLWCDVEVRANTFVPVESAGTEADVSVSHIEHADGLVRDAAPQEAPEIEVHHDEPAKKQNQPRVETEKENDEVEVLQRSSMIFPKLDKESSVSTSGMAEVEKQAPVGKGSMGEELAVPASGEVEEADDLADEVASLDLDDESQDGFLTDDEYDILNASDEEYLVEAQKAAQK